MIDLLVLGGQVVTVDDQRRVFSPGGIAVDKGVIIDVGPEDAIRTKYTEAVKVIQADGKAVFPGLINTHTHLFQVLLKGLGDDRILFDWLKDTIIPAVPALKHEDVYAAAAVGCYEALKSGTTTILDYMYAHPVEYLGDEVIKAFQDTGIRGILGRGYSDSQERIEMARRNGRQGAKAEIVWETPERIAWDVKRLYGKYHGSNGGRIMVWLAPGSVWGNTAETFRLTRRLADELKTGITVHISETPDDRNSAQRMYGASDIMALEAMGVLGPDVLMVHCVHLTEREIRVTKALDVKISHNPVSNMYLSSGVAPVPRMLEAGITVSLATDGAGSNNSQDMLETLKFAALLHKVDTLDPTVITAERVLEMATRDGARALGLEDRIGTLEPGKRADLFVFNPLRSAKAVPMHNPVSTLVYCSGESNIETVVVDGEVVIENGEHKRVDGRKLAEAVTHRALELVSRAGMEDLAKRPWRSFAY
ncbi:MAG TPA: amidohydrolase [Clostridia bacterium]|nr:amidohydrolase [Clostridia bacterium]